MSISGAPESTSVTAPDDFPAQYDPAATEATIYAPWQQAGAFTADASRSSRIGGDRDPYGILMPPPNVTAILHVGHGLNSTVQDVLIRWARMKGLEALWLRPLNVWWRLVALLTWRGRPQSWGALHRKGFQTT